MKRVAPLLCMLALAGCGGGGGDDGDQRLTLTTPKAPTATATPKSTPEAAERPRSTGPVTAAEKRVIRAWADALRAGDVERAVDQFAVPAITANGTQPTRLLTRQAIREWNESLTCGAKLKSVERDANYVVGTFELTNRKGRPNGCGTGVGNEARTAFLIRDGKIAQWIRAPDPTDPADEPGGTTS